MLPTRQSPMALEPTTETTFHLKDTITGEYLHWSAKAMTTNKAERWKGTLAQANACRERFELAKSLTMVAVIPPAPKSQEYR